MAQPKMTQPNKYLQTQLDPSETRAEFSESTQDETQRVAGHGLSEADFLLLIRFLVGIAILGSSELMSRLREPLTVTSVVEPGIQATYDGVGDEELSDKRMYHILLGTLIRSQLWAFHQVLGSLNTTVAVGRWAFRTADRLTATSLLRPLRWPAAMAAEQLERQIQMSIRMGRAIELGSEHLAYDTVTVLTDQIIAYVSNSPELAMLVRTQIEQQSVGFSESFVGSGRMLSAQADDTIETIIRRLLGRGASPHDSARA